MQFPRDEIDNRRDNLLRREGLTDGWVTWLRGIRWSYFATGTTTEPVTDSTAVRIVKNWLASFPEAYAALGVQRGAAHLKHHVHMLVGGIKRTDLTETLLRGSWVKHGHIAVAGYHPAQGAVEYLVQQANEIELIGSPQVYHPRRRGCY